MRSGLGRIEQNVNRELVNPVHDGIPKPGRALLRTLARQMDQAEATGDLDASAKLGRVFLEALQAYGLAGQTDVSVDPFAAFVAGLSAPVMGDP